MKRFGTFQNSGSGKKLKLSCNNEDLWGDDPENDDFDDYLLQATQIAEKEDEIKCSQANNTSGIPTYSFFDRSLICSTQLPGCSDFKVPAPVADSKTDASVVELSQRLQDLESKFKSKEGEVSILRTQLKQTRDGLQAEHRKKERELAQKLDATQKEVNRTVTELEFKNLTISKLRQKILDQSRCVTLDSSICISGVFPINANEAAACETVNESLNLERVIVTEFPLRTVVPPDFFNKPIMDRAEPETLRLLDGGGVNVHSLLTDEVFEKVANARPTTTKIGDRNLLTVEFLFPEVVELINSDTKQLDCNKMDKDVNKIICVALQILHNLHKYLKNLEKCMNKEMLQRLDDAYLSDKIDTYIDISNNSLLSASEWHSNENGIQSRQMVSLIAILFPFNSHLRHFIADRKVINMTNCDYVQHLDALKFNNNKCLRNNYDFLDIVLLILNLIGKMRKGVNFCGFTASACKLLSNICLNMKELSPQLRSRIMKITMAIVATRPNRSVLTYVIGLFEAASHHSFFVEGLCELPNSVKSSMKTGKNGTVYFNEDCCIFHIFSLLYFDSFLKGNSEKISSISLDMIKFASNVLQSNASWLYYQENKHYNCLCELHKMIVRIVHPAVKAFEKKTFADQNEKDIIKVLLRLAVNVLRGLEFISSVLIDRDMIVVSKYKYIRDNLPKLKDLLGIGKRYGAAIEQLSHQSMEETSVDPSCLKNDRIWNR